MNHSDRMVLGRQVDYTRHYDPDQLCPIPRSLGRTAAGIEETPSFAHGQDIWNIYELSWLSRSGKPLVAMAEVRVPWDSPCLIESKSLKLYCNSFNMTALEGEDSLREIMTRDLSRAAGADVLVSVVTPEMFSRITLAEPAGTCIDDQDISGFSYQPDPSLLTTAPEPMRETLFTRLFRSCCPVTGQPDWATVEITYAGPRIQRDALLRYLVSYREHQGFHEACVEKIHADISGHCHSRELEVSARFTRRGGLDINPVRSTRSGPWLNLRDPRQ
ncbi:MAG: NADPH-dependent 7-cyano-7-deazaguanine reductase QueF [Desulfomicrobium sp.]|nr:NADPH-dependent 7-cyano-7-deazaguanine reductase QueF [Pseudomonadota bacterium]MBV1713720.1 NADPH-dependent 7-cyano-7-deazaguanine reductase QueF [Desulfomicrobium sp.]MBU4572256.1 NADPH-dependent 7-cyano-7-deazaguanine reductase QueF [Pseudomonadota bacterium]MBU4594234.1 NADPH-dependent 7-cyano-7-deazaguanine reductase QueF [Pseudomonadota bacterium]MBV1721505.1 NADPH-dependent 7-cyano-7-deazaguanine reductase QueF [Desulfomicrobium sp.]